MFGTDEKLYVFFLLSLSKPRQIHSWQMEPCRIAQISPTHSKQPMYYLHCNCNRNFSPANPNSRMVKPNSRMVNTAVLNVYYKNNLHCHHQPVHRLQLHLSYSHKSQRRPPQFLNQSHHSHMSIWIIRPTFNILTIRRKLLAVTYCSSEMDKIPDAK